MNHIKKAFIRMYSEGWDYIYIAVDLHGTVFRNSENTPELVYYPYAEETLKYLSTRNDIKLIIFSSSHEDHLNDVMDKLVSDHIYFDYINENPDIESNKLSDFDRKFYFSVLLDDKAGFDPYSDWERVLTTIKSFEDDKS